MEWEQEQLRRGGHLADENTENAHVKPVYKPAPSKHIYYRLCTVLTQSRLFRA